MTMICPLLLDSAASIAVELSRTGASPQAIDDAMMKSSSCMKKRCAWFVPYKDGEEGDCAVARIAPMLERIEGRIS